MPSSVITKKILATAMKELMETTPFSKVSIGDITKKCEMNRNSFYYHFQDKYELLNWIFLTEITKIFNDEEILEISSWEIIDRFCHYFYANKVFYMNALSYEGQNSFMDYFREILKSGMERRTDNMFADEEDEEYQEFFYEFFLESTVTMFVKWIQGGAKTPPDRFSEMLKKALTGGATIILGKMQ